MADQVSLFCLYGLALGIFMGFLAACIDLIINSFFRWALR